MYLPKAIQDLVGDEPFEENHVGMSDSRVLMFQDKVLKIQPQNVETENEIAIEKWLNGRAPVPKIYAVCSENGLVYELMERISGKMLCDDEIMENPKRLVKLVAEGLKLLWKVQIDNCPLTTSRLSERLKEARKNVENGEVDMENTEPETFGPGGFRDAMDLLEWLETHQPKEDLVLTHGDFCLPNLFCDDEGISGYIDTGKMGPADRWQDIAIALRSLKHNADGKYRGWKPYFDFQPQMLFDELGIEMDEEKNRYYLLLDELF